MEQQTQTTTAKRKVTYHAMETAFRDLIHDMRILAGDTVGPSGASWQDVAGTASVNARVLANLLVQARDGNYDSALAFPSPDEMLDSL